jgi:hypothetical protein
MSDDALLFLIQCVLLLLSSLCYGIGFAFLWRSQSLPGIAAFLFGLLFQPGALMVTSFEVLFQLGAYDARMTIIAAQVLCTVLSGRAVWLRLDRRAAEPE